MQKRFFNSLAIGISGLSIALALSACGHDNGADSQNKIVTLAIDVPYKPFVYRASSGELQGFEIDYGNELCKRAQLKCKWVEQNWDGIIPGLLSRKYNAILSSMAITPEREHQVLFSHPYYQTPSLWILPKNSTLDVTDKAAMKGKSVGVQRGTIRDVYVTNYYSDILNIRRYASTESVATDLKNGRLDMAFEDYAIARNAFDFEKDDSPFKQVGPAVSKPVSIFGTGAAMAFRPNDKALADKFNKAIDEMNTDGSFKKLMYKYFNYDISIQPDEQQPNKQQ